MKIRDVKRAKDTARACLFYHDQQQLGQMLTDEFESEEAAKVWYGDLMKGYAHGKLTREEVEHQKRTMIHKLRAAKNRAAKRPAAASSAAKRPAVASSQPAKRARMDTPIEVPPASEGEEGVKSDPDKLSRSGDSEARGLHVQRPVRRLSRKAAWLAASYHRTAQQPELPKLLPPQSKQSRSRRRPRSLRHLGPAK